MSSQRTGETPEVTHGNASSSTRTAGTPIFNRKGSISYVPKVDDKVQVWSKTSGSWLDGAVVECHIGMAIKLTIEYMIPDVGRAQKTLLATSVDLRFKHPSGGKAPSRPAAETVAATGCAENENGAEEDDDDEDEYERPGDANGVEAAAAATPGAGVDEPPPAREREAAAKQRTAEDVAKAMEKASNVGPAEESGDADHLTEGDIVADGRFELHHQLGSGSFSVVRLAKDLETGNEVALKLEVANSKVPQLIDEARRYKHFADGIGLPAMHWYGTDAGYNIMAMDLLGPSLEVMLDRCDRSMSLETVVKLGRQMLDCLEYIHSKDYIHRDLKPNNFCLGHGDRAAKVFCIDFGLAKRYRSPAMLKHAHIPFRGGLPFLGTVRYASVGAQLGEEQSRRDDLQALGYVFLYLLSGTLPWQGLTGVITKDQRRQMILEMKQALSTDDLCAGAPVEFAEYMDCVQDLAFEETPDYKQLKGWLKAAWEQQRQASEAKGQPQRKSADLDEFQDGASAVSER